MMTIALNFVPKQILPKFLLRGFFSKSQKWEATVMHSYFYQIQTK